MQFKKIMSIVVAGSVLAFSQMAGAKTTSNDPQINKAMKLIEQGQIAQGQQILENLANQGNADAAFRIGSLYMDSKGKNTAPKTMIGWFEKAAQLGDVRAPFVLGSIYSSNYYNKPDYKLAYKWYEKCAQYNDPKCIAKLASFKYEGVGTKRDLNESLGLFEKAASMNEPLSQATLGLIFAGEDPNFAKIVKIDPNRAFENFHKAYKNGYLPIISYVGDCYYNGFGVKQDKKKAYEYYLKGADQKDTRSQIIINELIKRGEVKGLKR